MNSENLFYAAILSTVTVTAHRSPEKERPPFKPKFSSPSSFSIKLAFFVRFPRCL